MNTDHSTWNYWFAFWCNEDKTKVNYTISRTPDTVAMVDMMKQIIKKKPDMGFTPTMMVMGRLLNSKDAHGYYERDEYKAAMDAIMSNDTDLVADVCVVKLVEATSKEQFERFKLHYNTFDQLGSLIASQRKKSRS